MLGGSIVAETPAGSDATASVSRRAAADACRGAELRVTETAGWFRPTASGSGVGHTL